MTSFVSFQVSPSDVPKHGIRLNYIDEFISLCGGVDAFRGLTTDNVCKIFIKAKTAHLQCSYCEMLLKDNHPAVTEDGVVFISHAWTDEFLAVMMALKYHFRNKPNVVIWFDIFTVNQHNTATRGFSWWSTTFKSAIASFAHTVMVLAPWKNPLPLTRAWCLFELWATVDTKSKFEVAMTESEMDHFVEDICRDTEKSVNKMLATIDVSKSKAYSAADEQQIKEAVKNSVGYGDLNMLVFKRMRSWMVETAQRRLETSPDDVNLIAALGELFRLHDNFKEAELKLKDALEKRRKTLGDRHVDTLASFRMLGNVYIRTGHLQTALEYSQAAYDGCLETLGENHPQTLKAIVSMGNLYYSKREYDTAIPYYQRGIDGRTHVLGETHPDTIKANSNLANCYKNMRDYDAAMPLYQRTLGSLRHTLGENHPDTLSAMFNLANLYKSKREYGEAETHYSACREGRAIVLGKKHKKTLEASAYRAECLRFLSRFEEALTLAKATRMDLLTLLIDRDCDLIKYCDDTIKKLEGDGDLKGGEQGGCLSPGEPVLPDGASEGGGEIDEGPNKRTKHSPIGSKGVRDDSAN